MFNILFITGKLNITDGVTSHLYNLVYELSGKDNVKMMILCTGGNSIDKFKKQKIKIIIDPGFDHGNRSLSNFSSSVKKLIRIIKDNQINIVHSHNHYAANIAFYASKVTAADTVQTIHGLIHEGGFLRHFRANQYITVNEPSKKFLITNNFGTDKNAIYIDQGVRHEESLEEKSNNEIRIICASRLIYEKGVDLFIKAAGIVRSIYSGNVKFMIAGSGEFENKLKDLNTELKAGVEFIGEVKDLQRLLAGSNIFVMPSRSGSEGFPMTIAEAALNKNLIITSEFNSFGILFRNNIDGFIFQVDNYQELAERILEALNNPERAIQMSETFYCRSKEIFDPGIMTDKHLEVYKRCLKK